jgi:hypothetical protein
MRESSEVVARGSGVREILKIIVYGWWCLVFVFVRVLLCVLAFVMCNASYEDEEGEE